MPLAIGNTPSSGSFSYRKISVPEYHRMLETEILRSGEPYELLGGYLVRKDRSARGVDPGSMGKGHIWTVSRLTRISRPLDSFGCYMQLQCPVVISNFDEPEPDAVILRGTEDDYKERRPEASDVSCVIEVADSSLANDRGDKLSIYADSGIPQYVIINLVDRVVEVYTQPESGTGTYAHKKTLTLLDTVQFSLPSGQSLPVPVQTLLP